MIGRRRRCGPTLGEGLFSDRCQPRDGAGRGCCVDDRDLAAGRTALPTTLQDHQDVGDDFYLLLTPGQADSLGQALSLQLRVA